MMARRSLGCDLEQIPPGTDGDWARRREVSVIPEVVTEDDGAPEDPRERFPGSSGLGRILGAPEESHVVTG
jgi:hypothetical protein